LAREQAKHGSYTLPWHGVLRPDGSRTGGHASGRAAASVPAVQQPLPPTAAINA
jgi:hypothetical protein